MRINLFKRVLFIVLTMLLTVGINISAKAQKNLGFEWNNFTNWKCYVGGASTIATSTGTTNTTTTTLYVPKYVVAGVGVKANYLRVTTPTQKNDHYGNFPVVCNLPGAGKRSVKIGTDSVSDGFGGLGISTSQGLVYNLKIPANNQKYRIVYYYAIDLEDPGSHSCW